MRIGFPMEMLPLGEAGGVETYARSLISSLQRVDSGNEYFLLCSERNQKAFQVTKSNFRKIVTMRKRHPEKLLYLKSRVSEFMEETRYLRGLKRTVQYVKGSFIRERPLMLTKEEAMCDMLHYMFTTLPYWVDYDVPVIVTIHDIQQEYYPEFFSKVVLEKRRRFYRPSAEKASQIIAISEFTKKTLNEKYGIRENKISIIYHGYDDLKFQQLDKQTIERFRKKYNLPTTFLLYPAATWQHKNHLNLVRGFKIMKQKYDFRGKLVLTGKKKENHYPLKKEIKRLGLKQDIFHFGYLPYEELSPLFNAAHVLVFPSLFEGFGIPVVEAMAVGLPVACSNTTSLPEVAGDTALFFDPTNPEDIADKVFTLSENNDIRESLIQRGLDRAKLFTWSRTANQTLRLYKKVYGNVNKTATS